MAHPESLTLFEHNISICLYSISSLSYITIITFRKGILESAMKKYRKIFFKDLFVQFFQNKSQNKLQQPIKCYCSFFIYITISTFTSVRPLVFVSSPAHFIAFRIHSSRCLIRPLPQLGFLVNPLRTIDPLNKTFESITFFAFWYVQGMSHFNISSR